MKKRTVVNYFVDIGMLIAFVLVVITGIFKWPSLLPALGIPYSAVPLAAFTYIHDWAGLILSILAIIHVVLHWKWIVAMTKKMFSRNKE